MARKIYISGRTEGLPKSETRRRFADAARRLRGVGYETANPLRDRLPSGTPREAATAVRLLRLMGCDAVYMLPDWQMSREATLEREIAELTGKEIVYETAPPPAEVTEAVRMATGLRLAGMTGPSRRTDHVYARKILARLLRERGWSTPDIGKTLRRNRRTVEYYLRTYDDEYRYTPAFRRLADLAREYVGKTRNEGNENDLN